MGNDIYEYTVTKKPEGRYLLARLGMVSLYILFVALFFAVCYASKFVMIFTACPLMLLALVVVTWRYVSVEYAYAVDHGQLKLYTVYGGKSKKLLAALPIKDAVGFISLAEDTDTLTVFGAERTYSLLSSQKEPKEPYALLLHIDGVKTAVLLEAPEPSRKALLYYIPRAVRAGDRAE